MAVRPDNYSGELHVQFVAALLGVIALIGGYWLGTSLSSQRKTESGDNSLKLTRI